MDHNKFKLRLMGRYPFMVRNEIKHRAVHIDDDDCLEFIFSAIDSLSLTHFDLCVEYECIPSLGLYTSLLTQFTTSMSIAHYETAFHHHPLPNNFEPYSSFDE